MHVHTNTHTHMHIFFCISSKYHWAWHCMPGISYFSSVVKLILTHWTSCSQLGLISPEDSFHMLQILSWYFSSFCLNIIFSFCQVWIVYIISVYLYPSHTIIACVLLCIVIINPYAAGLNFSCHLITLNGWARYLCISRLRVKLCVLLLA
jgi:hypothetical protein